MSAHGKLLVQSPTLAERRAELAYHVTLLIMTSTRRNLSHNMELSLRRKWLSAGLAKTFWFCGEFSVISWLWGNDRTGWENSQTTPPQRQGCQALLVLSPKPLLKWFNGGYSLEWMNRFLSCDNVGLSELCLWIFYLKDLLNECWVGGRC